MNGAALSIVIPCWNDSTALRAILETLQQLNGVSEIIVADASQTDVCRETAAKSGVVVAHCPRPNRGAQLNAGARCASGDILLFQHADTELTQPHIDNLRAAGADPEIVGGGFHRKFDDRHPHLLWLEEFARYRNDHGSTLYGDQSIFVRREIFQRMGGFAEIPLMEDVEFSRRLRKAGRTVVLDPPICTSARHHARRGSIRTSIRNGTMLLLYRLGFSPDKLHAWYYRHPIYE